MSDVFYASDLFCAFLLGFILKSAFDLIHYLLSEPIRNKWRRDCNFDCSKCKVFDCTRNDCLLYKEKYERKLKKKELENK